MGLNKVVRKGLKIIRATEEYHERLQAIGMHHDDLNYVVLENDKVIGYFAGQIGEGYYCNQDSCEMYLEYITVEVDRGQGYGRSIVNAIFMTFPAITKITAETNDDNYCFWKRVGADIPVSYTDEFREIYEFTLTRDEFYRACE